MRLKLVKVVGGLGSQMMAYALYLALLKAYPSDRVICDFSGFYKHGRRDHNGAELHRIFGLTEQEAPPIFAWLIHSQSLFVRLLFRALSALGIFHHHRASTGLYNYDPSVMQHSGRTPVVFDQCWTSWKYFESIEANVRQAFRFPAIVDDRNRQLAQRIQQSESVALHVRRGDYLSSSVLGGVVGELYYQQAVLELLLLKPEAKFFVFSDDADWCRKHIQSYLKSPCEFIDWNLGQESYRDMQLMSLCRHHIIPNSSFSWWAAVLASHAHQIVISPKQWVNPQSGLEMKDMNKPGWRVIDNSQSMNRVD